MTSEQRKKAILAALSVGAVGIAGGLAQLNSGDSVDCSLKAECQRLDENAAAEIVCPTLACAEAVQAGYRETLAACPAFKPSDCDSLEKRP